MDRIGTGRTDGCDPAGATGPAQRVGGGQGPQGGQSGRHPPPPPSAGPEVAGAGKTIFMWALNLQPAGIGASSSSR
eukprot:5758889-Pyramimonas_sp.AAC.1